VPCAARITVLPSDAQLISRQFTFEYVPRTAGELSNGWGGAVNDVANGNTDMFWSSFFLTSQRAAIVDVSASWLDTGLIVVGLADLHALEKDTGFSFAKAIEAPFSPFSRALWGCTLFAMICESSLLLRMAV